MRHNEQNDSTLPMEFKFNSAEKPIRFEIINQVPWAVAKDVCLALDLNNNREAIRKLDDDETMVSEVLTPSRGKQKMTFVNESGIYSLIFRSNKPEARLFRKWVTNEVLPQIRRNGHYSPTPSGEGGDPLRMDLTTLILKASEIAGTQRRLAQYLNVSESVLTDIRNRPGKISAGLTRRIEVACRDIVKIGEVSESALRSLNSKDLSAMWFDIALIESYEVRKRISIRMKRILNREDASLITREKGGDHA